MDSQKELDMIIGAAYIITTIGHLVALGTVVLGTGGMLVLYNASVILFLLFLWVDYSRGSYLDDSPETVAVPTAVLIGLAILSLGAVVHLVHGFGLYAGLTIYMLLLAGSMSYEKWVFLHE